MKKIFSLITTAAVLLTPLAVAAPAHASNEYVASEEYFEAPDGTQLYAQVFRPAEAGDAKTPVILVITPYQYFLTPAVNPQILYPELQEQMRVFEKGYTIVQAESQEAAAKLFLNHPHFMIFPGDGVEIMECLPLPER